ncbi:hypothetical protein BD311DRAFT_772435 [Dichomitus squalens]|uniref:Uncharacterized protein n=1 Tax=Dichomitus squalens TaxID=114155 RepID=A0A4Q9M2Z8_9APHY|nr:hypothetical protein BD311DRAFT_772435 [Dichomitus squalens]
MTELSARSAPITAHSSAQPTTCTIVSVYSPARYSTTHVHFHTLNSHWPARAHIANTTGTARSRQSGRRTQQRRSGQEQVSESAVRVQALSLPLLYTSSPGRRSRSLRFHRTQHATPKRVNPARNYPCRPHVRSVCIIGKRAMPRPSRTDRTVQTTRSSLLSPTDLPQALLVVSFRLVADRRPHGIGLTTTSAWTSPANSAGGAQGGRRCPGEFHIAARITSAVDVVEHM